MSIEINIEKLKNLLNNGCTIEEISNDFGVNRSTIKRRMKENGLKSKFSFIKNENIECLNCKNQFQSLKKNERKFCSKSCSSVYNNTNRKKEIIKKEKKKRVEKKVGICLNCNEEIFRADGQKSKTYCSIKCQQHYKLLRKIIGNIASSKSVKRFLIIKHGEKCMKCGWCEVNKFTNKIPIEIEHIDGNSNNNKLENVELLCPNCHSLTPTFRALNVGNGRSKRRERYKEGKSY